MSDTTAPPWIPPTKADYLGLSHAAQRVMWDILNGDHLGARKATDTPSEREAIAAKCVVTDGEHTWVTQEAGEFVPSAPPDLCSAPVQDTREPVTADVDESSPCPSCGERGLWRESVDVGVGTMHGPFGCECCGWSEDKRFDRRAGPAAADEDYTEHACDQWGMGHWVGPEGGL